MRSPAPPSASFLDAFSALGDALGEGDAVLTLPIESVDEDPDNPRRDFDADELSSLAATIAEKGLLQPITVRPAGADGRYRLRFGARRLRAAKLAGLKEVTALVRKDQADEPSSLVEQLIENDQRAGLSTAELARSIDRLLDLGMKQVEIARRLGRSRDQIALLAAVRDMPAELKDLAPRLGARTLFELHSAWKADQNKTRSWLSGRDLERITQAEARALAGRNAGAPDRGPSLLKSPPRKASNTAPRGAEETAPTGGPAASAAPASHGLWPIFEIRAPGVTGTLVLDNVKRSSVGLRVRLTDGTVRTIPAADITIVRVRPG